MVAAATADAPDFFLGTDSAPHVDAAKETGCGCAGCFTATNAMALLAHVFEEEGVEQAGAFMGTWLEALIRTGALRDIDAAFIAKNGERIPILFSRTAVCDADGKISDIICIAKNMRGYRKVAGQAEASTLFG